MNRKERRNRDREIDKTLSWINGLPQSKREFLNMFITREVNKVKTEYEVKITAFERCSISALIENTELTTSEIDNIFKTIEEHLLSDEEMIKYYKEKGEDLEMGIEEVKKEINKRIYELLYADKEKKECLETLALEFPTASKTVINTAYKKAREQYNKPTVAVIDDKRRTEAVRKAVKDFKEKAHDGVVNGVASKFEVLETVRTIKGAYGEYIASKNTLEIDGEKLCGRADIEKWREDKESELKADYLKMLDAIKNNTLELHEVMQEFTECK